MKLKEFKKERSLRKLRRNKNKDKYIMISTISVCITVLIIAIMYFTFARYESLKDFEIINGSVGDFKSGDFIIAAFVDGNKSKSIPEKDSGYYLQKVECENGANGSWDSTSWSLTVENAKTQTKCYVYFTTLLAEADTTGQYSTLSKYYPVGSIYQSLNSTSPATLFGGTWQEIKDTMLMARGTTFTSVNSSAYTKDGGNTAVSLSANQIPTLTGIYGSTNTTGGHTHSVGTNLVGFTTGNAVGPGFAVGSTNFSYYSGNITSSSDGAHSHSFSNGIYANNAQQQVNVLNPYKVVYMWVRVA